MAYAVLAAVGLIPVPNTTFGPIPLFGHDVRLHAPPAAGAARFGFMHRGTRPGRGGCARDTRPSPPSRPQESLELQPHLIGAAPLAVRIMLGVPYESFPRPITIISTLPSAGWGHCRRSWPRGEPSILEIIGIVLLKKDAIMPVDFALEAEAGAHRGGPAANATPAE